MKKTKIAPLGTVVPAVLRKLPRASKDGRSNVWPWTCGHCGSDRNTPFSTRLNSSRLTCDDCGADNYVDDFDAAHDRLKGLRDASQPTGQGDGQ